MADALKLFYWDACIFYEYLNEEQSDKFKKQKIDDLIAENKDKRNRICTSVVTHLEIIPKKLLEDKERQYWAAFQSIYFFDIELDRNIIALARKIKDFYYKPRNEETGEYRMMSSPDALHLATAIIHSADEFHTRDRNTKGGNVKLLGLPESSPNGMLCGEYPLRIISPEAKQVNLDGI
jgi:hypothetical protein